MQIVYKLQNLLYSIREKENYSFRLQDLQNQMEKQAKEIGNKYLPLKNREANYLGFTLGIGLAILKMLWIYFLVYIVVAIVLSIIDIILILPGWLFGFRAGLLSAFNTIMYVLTLPAVGLGRFLLWLFSPWAESMSMLAFFREAITDVGTDYALDWDFIALSLGVVFISSIVVVISLIVLDIFLIPIRSAGIKRYNAEVLRENEEIKVRRIKALESWASSLEYEGMVRSIEEINAIIQKSEQAINDNRIVHGSLKSVDKVGRLINILETGRASNLENAINRMDEEIRNERLEQLQWEAIRRAEEEAERRAEDARVAQVRAEALLAEISDNTERTARTADAIFWMGVIDLLED